MFSVALSWQLNSALYLCGVHKPSSPLLQEDRASRARGSFPLCTSVIPRPMGMVFGLGMRLCLRMRTKLENGVLHNGQQPQTVMAFIHQGEFEAIKTLSGRQAPRCDKDQIRAKMTVST